MYTSCRYRKSKDIVKNESRKAKLRGKVPIFECERCKRIFCIDEGFKWKHYSKEKIIDTIELYVGGGVSTRYAAQYLNFSKNTIIKWVLEYAGKVSRFTRKLVPRIIKKINLDELFLKMCNQFFYL